MRVTLGISSTIHTVRSPRRRALAAVATVVALALLVPAAGTASTAGGGTSEVIVRARDVGAAVQAVRDAGGTIDSFLPIVHGVSARVPAASVDALRRRPGVVSVTANLAVTFSASDGTSTSTINSVFAREVNADRLWKRGIDGKGVRVALVDTGVTPVEDLKTRLVRVPHPVHQGETADCADLSGEGHCLDSYGHGTFVAGLIAGTGALSGGTWKGVAPGAEIVSIKIAGRDGSADITKVLAAIQYVVLFKDELGIDVLNLSLGTNSRAPWQTDPLNYAVQQAWRSGIVVVVAASNRGPQGGTISKPGDDPLVLTVGAVDDRETPAIDDDRLPTFSGRGPTPDGRVKPDVVAPGGRVISLRSKLGTFKSHIEEAVPGSFPSTVYRRGSGTSMSAGIVSGVAALVLQAQPTWTPDRVKFALRATARKVAARDENGVGKGLVDAEGALLAPAGVANVGVENPVVDATQWVLDSTRKDVKVTWVCGIVDPLLDPTCDHINGNETGQGGTFDPAEYADPESWQPPTWDGSSWYGSSWYDLQWAGSSWYGSSWYGSSWYGDPASWYGSSWYGDNETTTYYGAQVPGSSWYGGWD